MNITSIVNEQKSYFYKGHTRNIEERKQHLKNLYEGIQRYESDIFQALKLDLNKSDHESFTTEVGYVLKEISFLMKHLSSWSKPKRAHSARQEVWLGAARRYQAAPARTETTPARRAQGKARDLRGGSPPRHRPQAARSARKEAYLSGETHGSRCRERRYRTERGRR